MQQAEGDDSDERIARLMTSGIGTPTFMAPEIVAGDIQLETHPFACDVFSFGILAWQILTGDSPYTNSGMSPHQIKRKVVEGLRPPVPHQEGVWPVGVAELLQECWAGNAKDRPSFDTAMERIGSMDTAFSAFTCT